jgi:hypothetical protein
VDTHFSKRKLPVTGASVLEPKNAVRAKNEAESTSLIRINQGIRHFPPSAIIISAFLNRCRILMYLD